MSVLRGVGPYAAVVEIPSPQDSSVFVKFGVLKSTCREISERNLRTAIAQLYGIVCPGAKHARHLFKGLKRSLSLGDSMDGDKDVYVYAWRHPHDSTWSGSNFEGSPIDTQAPRGATFVVLAREQDLDEFGVSGIINRWNWVPEDKYTAEAPTDHNERYDSPVWSR